MAEECELPEETERLGVVITDPDEVRKYVDRTMLKESGEIEKN